MLPFVSLLEPKARKKWLTVFFPRGKYHQYLWIERSVDFSTQKVSGLYQNFLYKTTTCCVPLSYCCFSFFFSFCMEVPPQSYFRLPPRLICCYFLLSHMKLQVWTRVPSRATNSLSLEFLHPLQHPCRIPPRRLNLALAQIYSPGSLSLTFYIKEKASL